MIEKTMTSHATIGGFNTDESREVIVFRYTLPLS
jgi:hypothetical protein